MKILMSKREPTYLGLAVAFYDVDKVRETLTNNLNYPAKSKKVGNEIIFKFPLGMLDKLMLSFPQAHISDGINNYLIKKDQEEFDLLHANPPSISTPNWNSNCPLYDFQAVGVAFGFKRLQRDGAFPLTDDMGVGKTPTSLALIDDLRAYPALVITTKSGQYKWGREIDKFLNGITYAIVDGNIAVRKQLIQSKVDILIVSYPQVRLHPELNKIKFEAIIADEFHYIKNPQAQVTKAFHKLQGRYKIGLSGTPMLNGKPEELWSVLKWMYPNRFVKYSDFVKYITLTDGPYGPIAYRNLHKVRDFLKDRNLRRRKAQVLKSLPPTIEMIVEVDLTADQRRAYNEAKDNLNLWMKDGSRKTISQVMTKSMRLKQICFSPELYGGTESSSKVEEVKKIVEKLDATNQKVIIFSEFSTATRILQRELVKYNPAYVDGSVSAKNRDVEQNRFQNDENCRVYIGTIGANKEVIDLFAASYVIFVDRDWTPAYNEQAIARAWRNGQLKQVTVIILVAKDTVEIEFEKRLLTKSKMNSMMSDRNMVDAGQKISTVIGIEDIKSLLEAA